MGGIKFDEDAEKKVYIFATKAEAMDFYKREKEFEKDKVRYPYKLNAFWFVEVYK